MNAVADIPTFKTPAELHREFVAALSRYEAAHLELTQAHEKFGDLRQAMEWVRSIHGPRIGEHWAGESGINLGLMKGAEADYFLIRGPVSDAEMTLEDGKKWAAELSIDGHQDFRAVITRREGRLISANADEAFTKLPGYFWLGEQRPDHPGYAFVQDFEYGSQGSLHESGKARVCAVRSKIIQ